MTSPRLITRRHACALASILALAATRPLWAQTAPVLEAPTSGAGGVGASAASILLDDGFDVAPEAADAPRAAPQTPPSGASVVPEEGAVGARAMAWKYSLGRAESRLSWQKSAPLDLSAASSVALRLKSDAPGAIEIWFETQPVGGGAAARYSATVWLAGGAWQEVNIDRARFAGHGMEASTPRPEPMPGALWEAGWEHIARWGVADATNAWRLFAGQGRAEGTRTLWLDELKISTAPSPNPALPALVAPKPAALADGNGADGAEQDAPIGAVEGQDYEIGTAPGALKPQPQGFEDDDGNNGDGNGDGNGGDADVPAPAPAAAAAVPVQAVVQDAWGAPENWIPINGSTQALEGARAGLKWSLVRLANRDAMLISPVNAQLLRAFPPESVRRRARAEGVVISGSGDRLLRLAIAVSSAHPTILQVALHESDGAIWTARVPIDARRKTFVPIVPLADFANAPTRRDANGQIDLDRIVAVSLQDLGAQKGMAGPNDVTLRGMTWLY